MRFKTPTINFKDPLLVN